MRRHELDVTSLFAGLVLVAIAATYLLAEATGHHVGAGWVLPLALVGVGLAAVTGGLRRALRSPEHPSDAATVRE